jgi:hypothetical protein
MGLLHLVHLALWINVVLDCSDLLSFSQLQHFATSIYHNPQEDHSTLQGKSHKFLQISL